MLSRITSHLSNESILKREYYTIEYVEFEEEKDQIKKLLIIRDKEVRLVKDKGVLFRSEPFSSFIGDCEECSHYDNPNRDFITGGYCSLHNIASGYGFICKDNDSDINVEWKEFKNIQSEKK